MGNSKNELIMNNQLDVTNNFQVPLGKPTCTIDISGYLLDSYKTLNPEGYTMLCRLAETSEDFGISQQAAIEKSANFFSNIQVTVKPTGIENKVKLLMKSELIQELDIVNLSPLIVGQSKVIYFYEKF